MPSYSVVIRLSGNSKKRIKSMLRTAFGNVVAEEALIVEPGDMVAHEVCRVSGHFGCVHWADEDLQAKLEELNFPVTRAALDTLKVGYGLRHIDDRMVERGWEVIEQSILDAEIPETNLER